MKTGSARGSVKSHYPVLLPTVVLLAGISICVLITGKAYDIRGKYATETVSEFGQLPSTGVQAASLEFKGVVADYLCFKTLTYLGMKIGQQKDPTPEEWRLVYEMLQRVTDLDARFWDPYVLAEMMLAWHAGMFEEANQLLLKAVQNRPDDYRPNFYIGFNHFYFKKDAAKAAPFFRAAAQAPNAPAYLKGLAARVSLYAGQTALGIAFLESMIRETHDPRIAGYMEKRLTALKMVDYLEQWVAEYKKRTGAFPARLTDLVSSGLIPAIPQDPYGGEFTLLDNGRVYTTSELIGPEKHEENTRRKPLK